MPKRIGSIAKSGRLVSSAERAIRVNSLFAKSVIAATCAPMITMMTFAIARQNVRTAAARRAQRLVDHVVAKADTMVTKMTLFGILQETLFRALNAADKGITTGVRCATGI